MNTTLEMETSPMAAPTTAPATVRPLRLGKDSVAYRVLASNPIAGLLAGVPALSMQVLHPSIGAGVYDHSTLKKRPISRLQRTAEYVAGTGAASDEEALKLIRRTNNRHKPVKGTDPVTRSPFSADDPDLQIYVHVTEMGALLEAAKFVGVKVSPADEDRYWAEVAPIGAYLGAPLHDVPTTAAEASAVIERMLPRLAATEQGLDTIRFLLAPTGSRLFTALRPLMPLNKLVAAAMLPLQVRELLGLPTSRRVDRAVRRAVRMLMAVTRPFFTWLTFRLVGERAKRYYDEFPELTTPRAFTLPLPKDS
jgi:uncharacterized protein (DUF2236 family)